MKDWSNKSKPAARCRSGAATAAHGPLALRITKRGLAAIGVDEGNTLLEAEGARNTKQGTDRAPDQSSYRAAAARRKKTRDEAPRQSAKPGRRDSKQVRVIEMLQRPQGATIATITTMR